MKCRVKFAFVGMLVLAGTATANSGIFFGLPADPSTSEAKKKPTNLTVRPGLYNVTVTQTNSAYNGKDIVRPPAQVQKGQACIQPPGQIVEPKDYSHPGCEIKIGTSDSEITVRYSLTCMQGTQEYKGTFTLSPGDKSRLLAQSDFFKLPDGRRAFQEFYVDGNLRAEHGSGWANMNTNRQHSYVGECPS